MTIDKAKLKALAEAATKAVGPYRVETDYNGAHQVIGDGSWKILNAWNTPDGKGRQNAEFFAAANPATVLALLAEIDDQSLQTRSAREVCVESQGTILSLIAERDQLKAENEALRKDAERYRFVRSPIGRGSSLAIWHEGRLPMFSGMADAAIDSDMRKESDHD